MLQKRREQPRTCWVFLFRKSSSHVSCDMQGSLKSSQSLFWICQDCRCRLYSDEADTPALMSLKISSTLLSFILVWLSAVFVFLLFQFSNTIWWRGLTNKRLDLKKLFSGWKLASVLAPFRGNERIPGVVQFWWLFLSNPCITKLQEDGDGSSTLGE